VSTELANKAYTYLFITLINTTDTATKACAHLLIALTDATDLITEADLFVYSITAKLCYTSIVFIRIIVNTGISKKFIISYKQF
jgi:acetamidase/formamidase